MFHRTDPLWFVFLAALLVGAALSQGPAAAQNAAPTESTPTPTPTQAALAILEPRPGQAVQGRAPVRVNLLLPDLEIADLTFGYLNNPTGTWFLIGQSNQRLDGDVLAEWDTTTIADGEYTLRLEARLNSGQVIAASVPGLRVRNYSAIETDTPTPVTPTETPEPGEPTATPIPPTPTQTPIPPTATPLPTNPAEITPRQAAAGLGVGAAMALAALALLGLYVTARRFFRRR